MARTKSRENSIDPATGRPLPEGVTYRGPLQYRARKLVGATRVTKTFERAKLARDWLEETASLARRGEFVDRRSLDQTTLKELVQRFVDERMQDGGKRRGAAEDRGHVPSIMTDPIANLKLSRLGKADVRQFRDRQQELYSDATVVKRLNLLAAILNCAAREWDMPLPLNPASSTSVPRPAGADKKRNRRLIVPGPAVLRAAASKGEDPPMTEEAVLYTVLGTSGNEWDVWLTRWAIAQATRQGEALGLRWRDIDLDRKTFRVLGRVSKGTKNDQHREEIGPESRPLMPGAIFILNAIKPAGGAKPDTHVFPVGDHMAFRVRWGRTIARAAAGLPDLHREMGYLNDLTYHDLRHEATSRLAKIYTNPMDLKRVTGHRDLKSLDRYYQPDLTELAERAE